MRDKSGATPEPALGDTGREEVCLSQSTRKRGRRGQYLRKLLDGIPGENALGEEGL